MTDAKGSTSSPDMNVLQMQWDETSCPICMDHPHNAVLLICSSHEKGCRSYICDTSYRHSNCLDRFNKVRVDHLDDIPPQSMSSLPEHSITESLDHIAPQTLASEPILASPRMRRNTMEADEIMSEAWEESNNRLRVGYVESHNVEESASRITSELKCPLCRGAVLGQKVVKEARRYLDLKPRSCSRELCSFSGNYGELRRHARRAHPATRPAAVDPSRHRAWRDLEHQQEYRDILSAIRSTIPGAVVFGDYVIDDGDALSREVGDVSGPWWATLFLFHMMSSRNRFRDGLRSPSRPWRTRHHASGQQNVQGANHLGFQDGNDDVDEDDDEDAFRTWRTHRRSSRHRNLWGENLLGLQDDDDDDDDDDNDISIPRSRQRSTRFRPNGEGR